MSCDLTKSASSTSKEKEVDDPYFSGRNRISFKRALSRLTRSIMRLAQTNSAASKPKPSKIAGVPGPGVKIIMIPRSNRVNPARIRKIRRTCSTVRRIIEVQERIFLAERGNSKPLRRLKVRKVLILRSAGNATTARIAQVGYSSGTLSILTVVLLAGVAPAEMQPRVYRVPFHHVEEMIVIEMKVNAKPATFLRDSGANISLGSHVSHGSVGISPRESAQIGR